MLLEREQVLTRLTALLRESSTGAGRLVFLAGEAGIGKSSVVAALTDAVPAGLRVRSGGCDSVTNVAALGPILEAVPELSAVVEDTGGVDRLRLFRQLRAALAAEPTLLVLEDVHWADEATLDMLRFLGRRLVGLPLLVLATYRDDEPATSSPLTAVLGDLATVPQVVRVTLPPLTVAAVRELVHASATEVDADQVHAVTSGNPFFVTEVLAAPGRVIPVTVRDAVLGRIAALSDAGLRRWRSAIPGHSVSSPGGWPRQASAAARPCRSPHRSPSCSAARGPRPPGRGPISAVRCGRPSRSAPPRTSSTADHPARLTDRELEVLEQLARGMTNAEIGKRLFVSEKTIGHHVSAILRKLDEPSRAGAVAAALRRRIIAPM